MKPAMHDTQLSRPRDFLQHFAESEAALKTFVRSLLPFSNDSAEVMQQLSIVLWQKFPEFDATREFRRWAFGIARIEVLKFRRDRARDRHVFDDELAHKLADESIEAASRHDAQRTALDSCLQKLPAPQRDLVLAAYAGNARMDAIAAQRRQTAMSLYKMLQRIRQALLECVQRTMSREENL